MSWDVVLTRYRDGAPISIDRDRLVAALRPLSIDEDVPGDGVRIRTSDGCEAEVWGLDDPTSEDVTFSRFGGGELWDLMVQLARQFDLVIDAPVGATMIVDEEQRAHLPGGFLDAVYVHTGDDIERALSEAADDE